MKNMMVRSLALAVPLVIGSGACLLPAQGNPGQEAMTLEHAGKLAEAEAVWSAVAKADPANPEPWAHLGFLEAKQRRYSQAIAYYHKAMALNPSMPGLQLNLGLAYFKTGLYREAIQSFTPLLKQQTPSSPEAQRLRILIGMSHYGQDQFAAAVPFLSDASKRDPQNLPLLLALAQSCLMSRQYRCVLDSFHSIVALNPNSAEADMLAGEALDEMKEPMGAMKEFRAAIQANPKEPNAHFALGYLLWTQKQYAEAAQEFQAELDNTPGYTQAMLYLADSKIALKQKTEAQGLLEQVVKKDPGIAMAHLDLGIVYAELSRNEDALREFKAAEALKPSDVNVHWRLARLYRSMGRTEDAKREFEQASKLNKSADAPLLEVLPHGSQTSKTTPKASASEQK